MIDVEPKVVLLDPKSRWDGTCSGCNRDATVFGVKFDNGAWGRRCKLCAGDAPVMS